MESIGPFRWFDSPRFQQNDTADGETGCGFGGVEFARTDSGDATTIEVFDSVWDALEDTPAKAENMKLRSSLMIAVSEAVSGRRVNQIGAATRLGITPPRLNDLLRGRVGKFSLDALLLV